MFTFVSNAFLQHTLNPPLYEKYCTGKYSTEELKHCVLARGLNESACQAPLNTSQSLLRVETCTRSVVLRLAVVELYSLLPTQLHGVVLNLSTRITLLFILYFE
jgi:hypothetical protein